MTGTISITPTLDVGQRIALEQLLFFNVNQHRVRGGIEQSIETYGEPEIYTEAGGLKVRVGRISGVETVYAVSPQGRPLGVVVFVRADLERYQVLHLGIEPRLTLTPDINTRVLLMLMHHIRRSDRRTPRPASIELVYKKSGQPPRNIAMLS